jgi:hypothetical protein
MRGVFANESLRLALAFSAAAIFGSCTSGPAVPPGSRYIVTASRAQFYKYGPAQTFGPDFALGKGQKVTMVQHSFGYSRVTTDDGVTGYVSSDEVAPAPPEPKPPSTPVPAPHASVFSGRPKQSNVRGTPGSPLFDVNDVPMPLPSDPPRKDNPKFR